MDEVPVCDDIQVGGSNALLVIAGPCVIENRDMCLRIAEHLRAVCQNLGLPYVFKSSFDKANRTSISSYRGPGLEEGLRILEEVREEVGVPVLSDVHEPYQTEPASEVLDVLQVPAFLCRQTDLVVACADTGLPINVKKGQFMAPEDMGRVAEKIRSRDNERILLCERGTSFGYHDLVVDIRSIPRMQALGYPVIFDGTHATQQPGGQGDTSGGNREMAPILAAAAVAAGANGLFLETHPEPQNALSDSATMLPLDQIARMLEKLCSIADVAR